ncbi:MAG: RidA family protein [Pirellulales bacterium]|nr:RidA family protein [Pirellulales bacterium]
MSYDKKLVELGLDLPPPPAPTGLYKPMLLIDNMAYISGHGPLLDDGSYIIGRLGEELDQQAAYDAAGRAALAILSTLRQGLGSLDRIRRVVKLFGMVNCMSDFNNHPAVINGCSQVFSDIFGPEAGIGARSAVGVGSLPMGIPVEIEAIFEVEN